MVVTLRVGMHDAQALAIYLLVARQHTAEEGKALAAGPGTTAGQAVEAT